MIASSGIIFIYQDPRQKRDGWITPVIHSTPAQYLTHQEQPHLQDILTQRPTLRARQLAMLHADRPRVSASRPPLHIKVNSRVFGVGLIMLAIVGMSIPIIPKAKLESQYQVSQLQQHAVQQEQLTHPMPPSVPLAFNPLIGPDGQRITPVNTDFSIVIPKVGINSPVIAGVDPYNASDYTQALSKGVAHAKTSYFPNQDGAIYLFSHSTNYQWFVKDINAIFYNLNKLESGDSIIIFYKGQRYTYKYINRTIVSPGDTTYLLPVTGKRMLILQTCWPPGTVAQRLLLFADLVQEQGEEI